MLGWEQGLPVGAGVWSAEGRLCRSGRPLPLPPPAPAPDAVPTRLVFSVALGGGVVSWGLHPDARSVHSGKGQQGRCQAC